MQTAILVFLGVAILALLVSIVKSRSRSRAITATGDTMIPGDAQTAKEPGHDDARRSYKRGCGGCH